MNMNIEGRLERVEKGLRIYQGILAALIIFAGAALIREPPGAQAGAEPQPIPEKFRARAFEVVNTDGVIVARLGVGYSIPGPLSSTVSAGRSRLSARFRSMDRVSLENNRTLRGYEPDPYLL